MIARSSAPVGAYWPSSLDEELLRAALFDGPQALRAWQSVTEAVEISHLPFTSIQLLPLVYKNLVQLGTDDPDLPRLKGLYKRAWYENEISLQRRSIALRALHEGRLDFTVLKGAAVLDRYYGDRGLRHMTDLDLLVPHSQVRTAMDVLVASGWNAPPMAFEGAARFLHGWEFRHPDGYAIDLHWRLLEYLDTSNDDAEIELERVPSTLAGVPVFVLDHADQLVHTLVHAARWTADRDGRWVADAVLIMRGAEELNWNRVATLCEAFGCAIPVTAALRYLAREFDAPVPIDAVEKLDSLAANWRQRRGYLLTASPPRGPRALANAQVFAGHYLRTTSLWPLRDVVFGVPRFLQESWNLESPWQVLTTTPRKILSNIRPGSLPPAPTTR